MYLLAKSREWLKCMEGNEEITMNKETYGLLSKDWLALARPANPTWQEKIIAQGKGTFFPNRVSRESNSSS